MTPSGRARRSVTLVAGAVALVALGYLVLVVVVLAGPLALPFVRLPDGGPPATASSPAATAATEPSTRVRAAAATTDPIDARVDADAQGAAPASVGATPTTTAARATPAPTAAPPTPTTVDGPAAPAGPPATIPASPPSSAPAEPPGQDVRSTTPAADRTTGVGRPTG